mmetsp:Transcript_19439/g.27267  ORF Transcript_19439/g.27267 Transcript_19439/m.27267 type:complete len:521 (-) Transcript_19439:237-1799(-)|eukprot:CAMPEP_0175100680 /NCGR_PEP_ID=MMETSP0086_2-20121207/7275_1 /TAXON_ID=136419 /ORGANISM="Unknown Unknown, Strain D1" /LENGTH=520 /DNA_ID=CAMNT_0016374925 /DNA_START=96 /DNA_END=1658 /DNA_ORIENTATION=+
MAVQGQYARNRERRQKNYNADIDESLFGKGKSGGGSRNMSRSGGRVTGRRGTGSRTGSGRVRPDPSDSNNCVTVSINELFGMKERAVILTKQEIAARKAAADQDKALILAKAKARKEKMLRMEEERKKKAPQLTEEEMMENEKNNVLLAHAKQAMNEELDDVKHMNQMMLYAKCVTIRDAQVKEKERRENEEEEEQKRLDKAMEVERIKTLQMFEEREKLRQQEQRQGALVIVQQIQEREAERIRQQELREQEAQAMIQRIKELEVREEEERQQKVVAGRRLLEQVMQANNAQARSKLRKKQEELEEDRRIAEYIKAKEAREAAKEAEAERIKAEKEMEVARLRAMQEKAQDRQSALDELRAKRYQEAADRAWRKTQLTVAAKKEAMKQDIAQAREQQRREKAQRMTEQALQEREDYIRVLDWNRKQTSIEAEKEMALKYESLKHRDDLLSQIRVNEEEKTIARAKFLEEGKVVGRQNEIDKRSLLKIKQQKLELLRQAGVPEKYRAELAKKKVLVSSIH